MHTETATITTSTTTSWEPSTSPRTATVVHTQARNPTYLCFSLPLLQCSDLHATDGLLFLTDSSPRTQCSLQQNTLLVGCYLARELAALDGLRHGVSPEGESRCLSAVLHSAFREQ